MATNHKKEKYAPKNLIKSVLGQVPFTAELYWLVRHPEKTLNSRFSLKKLDDHIVDLTSQVERIREKRAVKGKKVFVFATLHFWIEHAALTSLSLSAMGNDVTLGYLPYHDWQNEINKFDLRRQDLYAQETLNKAGNVINVLSLLDLHAGYKMLPEELKDRIEQICRYDTMYTMQIESVDTNCHIYKMRLKRNFQAARAAYSWLQQNKPDVVVVPNGTILEFGVIYEVARYLGIQVVSYEFGDQRQRIWISQDEKVMRQNTQTMWEELKEKNLSRAETEKIRDLFESRRKASVWKNFSRLWQQVPAKGVEIARQELGLDNRLVVLLATNVLGDSLTLGREIFTESMEEWLERTLQYFAGRPDLQFVIRVHPGEKLIHGQSMVDVIDRVLPKLPEHIHVIKPEEDVNTYDLIAAADLGLVYTTTVGLEMAMSGVPVIVVGDTHYRGKGFTLDPDSWVRYYKTLKAVIEDPSAFRLTDKQIEDAWAYAYRFFFDFPQPFPWHLVNPWENFEKNDIESIFNSRDWPQYERVLHYLAGEPMSWVS
jgi:DNA polymerase elongation subunit (family B)